MGCFRAICAPPPPVSFAPPPPAFNVSSDDFALPPPPNFDSSGDNLVMSSASVSGDLPPPPPTMSMESTNTDGMSFLEQIHAAKLKKAAMPMGNTEETKTESAPANDLMAEMLRFKLRKTVKE